MYRIPKGPSGCRHSPKGSALCHVHAEWNARCAIPSASGLAHKRLGASRGGGSQVVMAEQHETLHSFLRKIDTGDPMYAHRREPSGKTKTHYRPSKMMCAFVLRFTNYASGCDALGLGRLPVGRAVFQL